MHELLHAVLNESGISNILKGGEDGKEPIIEETIVRMLTPHLLGVLRQLKGVLP